MPHPYLLFCPYLPPFPDRVISFADWELGSLESFDERWADSRFKDQATAFLQKFVGPHDKPIDNPAILCKAGKPLDGQEPTDEELSALRLSLVFAYVDTNPRFQSDTQEGWATVTDDNAELHAWPIDLEQGRFTLTRGELVTVNVGGYTISDRDLVFRPPRDLNLPEFVCYPAPLVLTGIYETALRSLRFPGDAPTADRVRVALEWFEKSWLNTRAIQWPERLAYLYTAFEALTGTHENWKGARTLRQIFEVSPHTAKRDSETLVWSPEEKPVHLRTRKKANSIRITDLEHWFIESGNARNAIIHRVEIPKPEYCGSNPTYNGPFVFTAEYFLRGVIKGILSNLGFENAWWPGLRRAIKEASYGEEV